MLAVLAVMACASGPRTLPNLAATPLTLTASDGSELSLAQLWRGRAATVLVFWSASCPCVRRYQGRVDSLLDRYADTRVRILAVSSNAGESFADVLAEAKARGVRVPLFRDEGGRVAQAVGAHSTPTVVVLDDSGQIRFHGWIDNERLPGEPGREPWLDQAVNGLIEHRDFVARTPVYGCAISRPLWGASSAPCCHDQH